MNRVYIPGHRFKTGAYTGVKMIVFDTVGTVVRDGGLVNRTLSETFLSHGVDVSLSDLRRFHGRDKFEAIDHILLRDLRRRGIDQTSFYDYQRSNMVLRARFELNLEQAYHRSEDLALVSADLPALFESLRSRGVRVALNTGLSRRVQELIVRRLGLDAMVDAYVSSEGAHRGRPSPDMIHRLMALLDIDSARSVIKVGDTKMDILEGINAGCLATVGVLTGSGQPGEMVRADHLLASADMISPESR